MMQQGFVFSEKAINLTKKLKTIGSRRRASELIGKEYKAKMDALASQLMKGQIDILRWQIEMRQALREAWTLQLVAGTGGDKSKIDSQEYLKLGTRLKQQYDYLERFAADIQSGRLSEAQIAYRSRMYVDAAKMMYWQQVTGVELPAYPCDGSTACLTNCRCSWKLEYIKDETGKVIYALATWMLAKAEHCDDCIERGGKWVRLRVRVDTSKLSTAFKERVADNPTTVIQLRVA